MSEVRTVAGPGVRLARYGETEVIRGVPSPARWDAAWQVASTGDGVVVGYGLVMGRTMVEPTIGGRVVSGDAKGQPEVKIKDYDAEGRAWVALRVEVDAEGAFLKKKDAVTVVATTRAAGGRLAGESAGVGLHPLAVVTREGRIWQVEYFHLRYLRQADARGRVTHLFY